MQTLHSLRILCVDDHRDVADSEALVLEAYGCVVAVCYDGPTALAETLRFGPDVCLVDYNMPGMSGCEFARRVRGWRASRPVHLIAVTAHDSPAVREQTERAGFELHLVKPIDWEVLTTTLGKVGQAPDEREPIIVGGRR